MRQENLTLIPLQNSGNITSAAICSRNLIACSVQITATTGASGTLKLQVSNDDTPGQLPVNFSDISGASVTVTGAGAFLIPKLDLCYEFVRLVYTNTGTGTITANLKALGD